MGKFLLAVSVGILGASLWYLGWFGYRAAANQPLFSAMAMDSPCKHPLVVATLSPSIMTESESRALTLTLNAYGRDDLRYPGTPLKRNLKACTATIEILAPAFERDPPESPLAFRLGPKDESKTTRWILLPKRTGQHTIVIKGGLDLIEVPVTVVSDLGLTAVQTAWAAAVAAVFSFLALAFSVREGLSRALRGGIR